MNTRKIGVGLGSSWLYKLVRGTTTLLLWKPVQTPDVQTPSDHRSPEVVIAVLSTFSKRTLGR
jgi:hypothetical protein